MRRVDVLPQIVRLDEVPRVETRWWAGPLTAATLPQASASLALLRLSLARTCGDAGRYRYFGRATQSQQRQTVGSMSQIGGFQGQVRAAARLVAEHYSATAHIELRGATADRMRRSGGAERAASGGSGTFAGVGAITSISAARFWSLTHTHTHRAVFHQNFPCTVELGHGQTGYKHLKRVMPCRIIKHRTFHSDALPTCKHKGTGSPDA